MWGGGVNQRNCYREVDDMKRVFFLFKQSTLVYFRTKCYDRVDGALSLETQNNIIVIQPGLSGHAQLKQTGNQTFNQNYIFASVQFSSQNAFCHIKILQCITERNQATPTPIFAPHPHPCICQFRCTSELKCSCQSCCCSKIIFLGGGGAASCSFR